MRRRNPYSWLHFGIPISSSFPFLGRGFGLRFLHRGLLEVVIELTLVQALAHLLKNSPHTFTGDLGACRPRDLERFGGGGTAYGVFDFVEEVRGDADRVVAHTQKHERGG